MSTSTVSNLPMQTESKSAKKKRSKAETSSHESGGMSTPTEAVVNEGEVSNESPFMRELQKNIRNTTKKLYSSQRVDAIMAENPGMTLDDLVASKKINADQKAAAEKKPGLLAQIRNLEEQMAQFKKFGQEYEQRAAAEKAALLKAHQEELKKVKGEAIAAHTTAINKKVEEELLILSKFLRAAAAKRQAGDEGSEENRAFEGALLQVYGGDTSAVVAIQKLMSGSEEKVPPIEGDAVDFTYAQIKQSSLEFGVPEEPWTEEVEPAPQSDPTLVNAGMTELNDGPTGDSANGFSHDGPAAVVPEQSTIDASAANDVASSSWDREGDAMKESATFSASGEGWVNVQAHETDAAVTAQGENSWAEEVAAAPTNGIEENDGFHEVVRDHGRGRGNRGRGYRGRGRGRWSGNRGRGRGGHDTA